MCWTLSQKTWREISEPGLVPDDALPFCAGQITARRLCPILLTPEPDFELRVALVQEVTLYLSMCACSWPSACNWTLLPRPRNLSQDGHIGGLLILTLVSDCNRSGMEARMEMGLGLGKGWRQK